MKKLLLIMVLMGFLSAFIIHAEFTSMGFCSNSTVRLVNPGESIQDAINSANNGDTILVEAGTYNGIDIVVNKTLNILGKNAETTIIDGGFMANYIFHVIANNVTIENFTLKNTKLEYPNEYFAINVYNVTDVLINKVYILNASIGINIQSANYTKITYSTIKNCNYGLRFRYGSCNNTVINNTFENNNNTALYIADNSSKFNLIYHNNFVNNANQITLFVSNYFDNGYPCGGNYWSDHIALDIKNGPYPQSMNGSDGILDEAYEGIDNYPLAYPFATWKISVDGENFQVGISTNSTVKLVSLNKEAKTLILNLTVNENANGSCRISIPKKLLSCDSLEDWNITYGGRTPESLVLDDENYTYMYFSYEYTSAEEIVLIKGTYVAPELSIVIAIMFMFISSFLFVFCKMKRFKGLSA